MDISHCPALQIGKVSGQSALVSHAFDGSVATHSPSVAPDEISQNGKASGQSALVAQKKPKHCPLSVCPFVRQNGLSAGQSAVVSHTKKPKQPR